VHNLVADINRRAMLFERDFDNLYRAINASAETPRSRE
jgi:hypothetical protein